MADVTSATTAAAAPGAKAVGGAKTKPKTRTRIGRAAGKALGSAGTVAGAVGGPWGKALSVAAGIASSVIEKKLAPASESAAATAEVGQPGAGSTEEKLAALLKTPDGGGNAAGVSGGVVARATGVTGPIGVGSRVIGGVLVAPEPYGSEEGVRLAVAARVFGSANALELAVGRLIDINPGQLLTFCMNRGYR